MIRASSFILIHPKCPSRKWSQFQGRWAADSTSFTADCIDETWSEEKANFLLIEQLFARCTRTPHLSERLDATHDERVGLPTFKGLPQHFFAFSSQFAEKRVKPTPRYGLISVSRCFIKTIWTAQVSIYLILTMLHRSLVNLKAIPPALPCCQAAASGYVLVYSWAVPKYVHQCQAPAQCASANRPLESSPCCLH